MADDVKIPGLGEVPKKYAIIGGVAIVGIGGVLYWRWRQNQAAAQAAASTSTGSASMVTDPAGNQCAQVDSLTGYCPGTPEDEQAQQQAAEGSDIGEGYEDSGGAGYSEYPYQGNPVYTDPNGEQCAQLDSDGYCPGDNPITTPPPSTNPVTTNAEWVTEVDATFPNYTQALAMVLGGVPVTTAQKTQFLEAVGIYGNPPQGYPTPIQTTDTATQPAPPAAKKAVPLVIGKTRDVGTAALRAAGFKVTVSGTQPAKGSAYIEKQNPNGGTLVAPGSTVNVTIGAKK